MPRETQSPETMKGASGASGSKVRRGMVEALAVAAMVAAIASATGGLLADLSPDRASPHVPEVVAGAIGTLGLLTALTAFARRGPTRVARLKDALVDAFCAALRTSGLNPEAAGGEQHD